MKRLWKLIALNLGIILANTLVFSKAFLGITLAVGNPLAFAFGLTTILMSIGIFVWGNARLLSPPAPKILIGGVDSAKKLEDCLPLLKQNEEKKSFARLLNQAENQIARFTRRRETALQILGQRFSPTELSYGHFAAAINGIEDVMAKNCKSIVNRLAAFDEADFQMLKRQGQKTGTTEARMGVYQEYFRFVADAVEDNEQILLKLDMLLSEITKLDSLEDGELEQMPAMQEIDDLIKNAKYYRQ
ncbi:MAG: hypothetical protein LBR73_01535 [Oscillospiraceae bacterium]|jgi:hypothetical protein|nr:hypothetical protein [Oscillospiraceae bacterium]